MQEDDINLNVAQEVVRTWGILAYVSRAHRQRIMHMDSDTLRQQEVARIKKLVASKKKKLKRV